MTDTIDHFCGRRDTHHPNAIRQLAPINRRKILLGQKKSYRRIAFDQRIDAVGSGSDLIGDVCDCFNIEIVVDFSR